MLTKNRYIDALLNRDERIISEIYQEFYPKIYLFIVKNKGQKEDAEDVFQEALLFLIVTYPKKQVTIKSFEAYFFTVCKNIWKTLLIKRKKILQEHFITKKYVESDHLKPFIIEQHRILLYVETFQELSKNCRELLSDYFNGIKYQKLMKEHSYKSINTVRQRIFKCKKKLITIIQKDPRYHHLQL